MSPKIAIIGAGLSGLILANRLADALHPHAQIHLFEKSRGVGGRMATRHAAPFTFDHGTQFFTARTPAFQQYLAPLIAQRLIAEWSGKVISLAPGQPPQDRPWLDPHYVPVPNMNSLAKHLAQNLHITLSTEVAPLEANQQDAWPLTDIAGNHLGHFDWVISTAPPTQTIRLLGHHLPSDAPIHQATFEACYTLMLGFHQPWKQDWIAAKLRHSPLEWLAVNSTKPGRDTSLTSLVAHSTNAWAQAHIDDDQPAIQATLLQHLHSLTGIDPTHASHIALHRWRYALLQNPTATQPYLDPQLQLASTGDWTSASRIEDVWQSAQTLASHLLTLLQGQNL